MKEEEWELSTEEVRALQIQDHRPALKFISIDESCKIYHDGMVPFVASYIHNLGNCHRDRAVEFIHSKMTLQ